MAITFDESKLTPGEWSHACDSYGKVRHSRKACVYTVVNMPGGERIVTLAARIPNWEDARVMTAAKDMYMVLKGMNHVDGGYCVCPLNDGMREDTYHSTNCADARKAVRKVESNWADSNCHNAETEWMAAR